MSGASAADSGEYSQYQEYKSNVHLLHDSISARTSLNHGVGQSWPDAAAYIEKTAAMAAKLSKRSSSLLS